MTDVSDMIEDVFYEVEYMLDIEYHGKQKVVIIARYDGVSIRFNDTLKFYNHNHRYHIPIADIVSIK